MHLVGLGRSQAAMPVAGKTEPMQEERDVENGMHIAEESPTDSKRASCESTQAEQHPVAFVRDRAPRTFYFFTQLVLPLLTLIGMSFWFGWLLARFEMQGEIRDNDEMLKAVFRNYANHTTDRNHIWEAMANTSVRCSTNSVEDQLLQTISNYSGTVNEVQNCALAEAQAQFPYVNFFDFVLLANPELSFNWMKCYGPIANESGLEVAFPYFGLNPENNHDEQFLRYILRFGDDMYSEFVQEYPGIIDIQYPGLHFSEPLPHSDILIDYVNNATGSEGCTVHVAGGALFWFTVMTTIGYGNTAPTTEAGRLMIFTCGFLTIIGFLALNNAGSRFWRHLLEDVFHRYNMPQFISGPISVLFWLCMTLLWMLVIAFAMQGYRQVRSEEDFPLSEAYWFSYITTTTVGLGDIYIDHEEFEVRDMFVVPMLILMGFNFLGIFMEKGIDVHNYHFPEANGLKSKLQERRLKDGSGEMSTRE